MLGSQSWTPPRCWTITRGMIEILPSSIWTYLNSTLSLKKHVLHHLLRRSWNKLRQRHFDFVVYLIVYLTLCLFFHPISYTKWHIRTPFFRKNNTMQGIVYYKYLSFLDFSLISNSIDSGINGSFISQIIMFHWFKSFIEFINKRDSGWKIKSSNFIIWDVIQIFD